MNNQNNQKTKRSFYLSKIKEFITIFLVIYLIASFIKWLIVLLVGVGEDMGGIIISVLIFLFILIIGFIILTIYSFHSLTKQKKPVTLTTYPYITSFLLVLSLITLFFQLNLANFTMRIVPNEAICKLNLIKTVLVHNDPVSIASSRFPYRDCISTLALIKKDPKICNKLKNEKNRESCFYLLATKLENYNFCDYLSDEYIEKKYNLSSKNNCIDRIAEKQLNYKKCQTPLCVQKIAHKLKDKKVCDYIKKLDIPQENIKTSINDCYHQYFLLLLN